MVLRTQDDPNVLIGDTLADLPPPGEMKQGVLFHEHATGTCLVLVIDTLTGVRSWEPWCAPVTGPTGPVGSSLLYKFNGTRVMAAAPLQRFFADQPGESAGVSVEGSSQLALRYVVPQATTTGLLRGFIRFNTLAQTAQLQIVKNGVTVLGTLGIGAGVTGAITISAPLAFAAGDTVDLATTLAANETAGRVLALAAALVLS